VALFLAVLGESERFQSSLDLTERERFELPQSRPQLSGYEV
jgi:hypothetical protein